jgi:transposase
MDQGSSLLLDIDGLVVDRVVRNDAGRRIVHCSTDPQLAGWCPACGEQSRSPKAWVTTRPRDVRLGEDRPILLWRKRKWRCQVDGCERKVFTECLPEQPPPVTVLGVDETRRGKAHYETDPTTGEKAWVDRFDTGLVDLSGNGGLFAQVNGRTSKILIEWLQAQDPDWLANITHISMDTSATYARAARLALPDAVVVVDRFHLVALANKAVTDYRRELAWALRGRRGRKCDPEWAQRNRLLRAAETLTPDELAKVQDAVRRADPSGGLEKCWQGKELLRKLLKLAGTNPDRGRIFNALTAFYLHCADSEIAQLRRLAWTVHAWQNSIIAGLHTGISNGRTEGYNRIVKHIGRIAFGFRNQDNQKRRIRYACTRKSRTSTSSAEPC